MVTRAQAKYFAERGPSVDEMDMARLQRAAAAAQQAFAASTLLEAQEIIGAAVPSLVTAVTLSSAFDSPSGSAPQTTATRTLTVPAGNPGEIVVTYEQTGTQGALEYSLAGAANAAVPLLPILDAADTDTLDFTVPSGVGVASVTLTDRTTGATIGSFTITTT